MIPSSPSFFIFGANTDVGKTLFSVGVCYGANILGITTRYIKPIQTGAPEHSDAATVAIGCPGVETHTLLALKNPVSPHRAQMMGTAQETPEADCDLEVFQKLQILLSCPLPEIYREGALSLTFIEGAGGPASPTPNGQLQCDFYRPLRLPVVLVGDSKLGGISTTLAAYHLLHSRGYDVVALALFAAEHENHLFLKSQLNKIPVFAIPGPGFPKNQEHSENLGEWLNRHKPFWVALAQHLQDAYVQNRQRIQRTLQGTEQCVWWPFTQHQQVRETTYIDSAYGMDFQTQKGALYDGSASWWTQGPGHGHPALTDAAAYAAGRYGHVLFPRHAHHPAYELAQSLLNSVGQGWAERVFFSDNGSTAVEVALKMAFRLAAQRQGLTAQTPFAVLGLKGSYHGDTLGAMDATSPDVFKAQASWYLGRGIWLDFPEVLYKSGVFRVHTPPAIEYHLDVTSHLIDTLFLPQERKVQHPGLEMAYQTYIHRQMKSAQAQGVVFGALVLEGLVHGSHGMQMIDPLFQRVLCDVAREEGIPVVLDEVFSGLWRLGPASSAQALGICPDIACFGKLLTGGLLALGVTLASGEVFDSFQGAGVEQALLHGHSYTANPVACAVGVRAFELIQQSPYFCATTQTLGPFWPQEVVEKLSHHPELRRVLCLGSLLTLELEVAERGYASSAAQGLVQQCEQAGIEVRPLGNVVVVFAGFYTATEVLKDIVAKISNILHTKSP